MSEPPVSSSHSSRPPELSTWKDIAAYLRTSVRTVQRWEEQNGLPVHRVMREKRAAIFAYPHELDAWVVQRTVTPPAPEASAVPPPRPPLPPSHRPMPPRRRLAPAPAGLPASSSSASWSLWPSPSSAPARPPNSPSKPNASRAALALNSILPHPPTAPGSPTPGPAGATTASPSSPPPPPNPS